MIFNREIMQNSDIIRLYSSSRSSKVIDLGVNRNLICYFLLVINTNFGRNAAVLELLTLKCRKWLIFPTPLLFSVPAQGDPLEFLHETYPTKTRGMGYRTVKIS